MGGYGPLYEIRQGNIDYPCEECEHCAYQKECLDMEIPKQADDCYTRCEYWGILIEKGRVNDGRR